MIVTNNSGIHPAGFAVLLRAYEPEIEKAKSLIHIPDNVSDKTRMVETRAIVVEIGPAAWFDEPYHRAKVGDIVLISKFSGILVHQSCTKDSRSDYRMVNDKDIYAVIEE